MYPHYYTLEQSVSFLCVNVLFLCQTFILNLLLDSRFENFVPVLDSYLKETFTSPLVHA